MKFRSLPLAITGPVAEAGILAYAYPTNPFQFDWDETSNGTISPAPLIDTAIPCGIATDADALVYKVMTPDEVLVCGFADDGLYDIKIFFL